MPLSSSPVILLFAMALAVKETSSGVLPGSHQCSMGCALDLALRATAARGTSGNSSAKRKRVRTMWPAWTGKRYSEDSTFRSQNELYPSTLAAAHLAETCSQESRPGRRHPSLILRSRYRPPAASPAQGLHRPDHRLHTGAIIIYASGSA